MKYEINNTNRSRCDFEGVEMMDTTRCDRGQRGREEEGERERGTRERGEGDERGGEEKEEEEKDNESEREGGEATEKKRLREQVGKGRGGG